MTVFAALLGEVAVKSTAILAVAALLDMLLRRLSAAERHLLWACALAALLILPLAVWTAPALRVDLPHFGQPAAPFEPLPESPIVADIRPAEGPSSVRTGRLVIAQPPSEPPPVSRLWTLIEREIGSLAALVYAAVTALLLARLGWRLLRAHREARVLPLVADAAVLRRAEELRGALRLARPLSLRTTKDRTPWVWGLRRPIVALPVGFERAPQEHQRAALLHEAAHVARFDFATTIAAHVVRALYWFNPLAWLAWSRLQRESERACDDAVMAAGIAPAEYAHQLLALAHTPRVQSAVQSLATPMARALAVRERIVSIVADSRRRNVASARTIAWAASLAAALVAPLAALQSQNPPAAAGQSQSPSAAGESELVHVWRVDGPIIEVVREGSRFSYTFRGNIDAFSPDGRHVAILPNQSGSDRLEIRSAVDGALVHDVRHPKEVGLAYDIAFSPTGAIALGRHGGVSLYDGAAPDAAIAAFQSDPISGPALCRTDVCRATIGSLAFSPDGALLAFQEVRATLPAQNHEGFVYVVEAATGRRAAKLEAITGRPTHVAFSPDGRRLVAMHYKADSGGRRGPIGFRVWDTASWQLVNEVTGLGPGGEPLAIGAAEGAGFAAVYAAAGGRLELRDLERERVIWSVPLHSPPFERKPDMIGGRELTLDHVAIAPNGKLVVGYEGPGWMIRPGALDEPDALGYFGAIVVRDMRDGSMVAAYDIRNVKALAISPDSKTLLYSVGFHQTYVALAQLP